MSKLINLIITNTSTFINEPLEKDIRDSLKKKLGYMPENAAFIVQNAKFTNPEYDGYKSLVCLGKRWCKCSIKKDGVHFPTGLIHVAKQFFESEGFVVKLIDKRIKVATDPTPKYKHNIELRPYQRTAIEKAKRNQRGILKICTGGGKTLSSAALIVETGAYPFIFYVPSLDLLNQTKQEFEKFIINPDGTQAKIGIIGGGDCEIYDINVMTQQTAMRALGMGFVKSDEEDKEEKDENNVKEKYGDIKKLIMNAKGMIADECQFWAGQSCQMISDSSVNAYYKFGCSVSGETLLDIKHENIGRKQTIESLFEQFSTLETLSENDQEIIDISTMNIESRSWDGSCFCWEKIKNIIKHKNTKKMYRIFFKGKRKIDLTEDHSVFVIRNGEVVCVETSQLKENDILMGDDGNNWIENNFENKFSIIDFLNENHDHKHKIRVSLNLEKIKKSTIENFTNTNIKNCKKRNSGICLIDYCNNKEKLPNPRQVYFESANNTSISSNLKLSELAWLFGFWLGDGWIDGNRLVFAIERKFKEKFIKKIKSIKSLNVNITLKKNKLEQGSIELSICNSILACLFKKLFNQGCYNKRIPDHFIYNTDEKFRKELIQGIIDSDGHEEYGVVSGCRKTTITTTSKELRDDIIIVLRSLNCPSSFQVREPALGGIVGGKQIVGRKESYQIVFSKNSMEGINERNKGHRKVYKNINSHQFKILKIKEIEQDCNDFVYDLQMHGENPRFVGNGILLHNSGTPYRDQNDDILIESCFGKTIEDINASYLIDLGFLVKPDIYMIPVKNKYGTLKSHTYQEIYKEAIVENDLRNGYVAKIAKSMESQGKMTLILVRQIGHGKILEQMIPGSFFVSGTSSKKKRKNHIEAMKRHEAPITISSTIFDQGIDIRPLQVLIQAGSGKSSVRALQRVGRVIRPYTYPDGTEKKEAIVIDFMDHCRYMLSHSKKRLKIYQTEPRFNIETLNI